MRLVMMALLTGIITGSLFSWAKLPIPAPPTLAGIAGIIGIFLGFQMANYAMKFFS